MEAKVLLLCDDLFFTSRVQETARQVGVSIRVVREDLAKAMETASPALILADLDLRRGDPIAEIRDARAGRENVRIVAFVRHDEVERIRAAREAGASQVLARGAFSTRLPELLGESVGA